MDTVTRVVVHSLIRRVIGELFLGQSFGALDSERPPEYMENVDRSFINMGLKGTFPLVHMILSYLPIVEVQKLIKASENLRAVGGQSRSV